MTVDELIKVLMQFKNKKAEVVIEDADTNWFLKINRDSITQINDKVIIYSTYANRID